MNPFIPTARRAAPHNGPAMATTKTPSYSLSPASTPAQSAAALGSSMAIERALSRFGWLGDPDELLAKLGIARHQLRALEGDDEITAALETRRDSACNTPWRFEHPSPRARKLFEAAFAPHLHDLLRMLWHAVPYGYSVIEVVYCEPSDPANTTPGRIGIGQIIDCPFEWFRFSHDGTLYWADRQDPVDPRKMFAVVREASLRRPMGDAILAKAYWPWFFRTHGWKYWSKFLEQAAVPLLYGKTIGEKQALVDLLRSVSSGPVMAVGDADTIASVDTPGNSPNKFTEFETACCRRIQRLILGQTLTSGTDGGSGNRALGQVHNDVRAEKTRSDVLLLSQGVQRIVGQWAQLAGLDAATFVMEDGTGLELDRANRDKLLVDAGMLRFTPEYLREKYGLEESDFALPQPPPLPALAAPASSQADGALAADAAAMAAALSAINLHRPALPAAPGTTHAAPVPVNLVDGVNIPRPKFTAGQQAIEDQIDATLGNLHSPIQAKAIASAILHARSPDDLIERLGVALSDASDAQFRNTLERALFAADLMGYGQAQADSRTAS